MADNKVHRYLKFRSSGEDVKALQYAINKVAEDKKLNINLKVDGIVGQETEKAAHLVDYLLGRNEKLKRGRIWTITQNAIRNPASRGAWTKARSAIRLRRYRSQSPTNRPRTGNARYFADISGYQTNVNLGTYKQAGHQRIAIKASEGNDFKSDSFIPRWRQARTLGLERWAYHFARPSQNDPRVEARYFVGYVKAQGLYAGDSLVLDWEDPDFHSTGNRWVADFADEVKKLTGRQLEVLYSYGSYLSSHTSVIPAKFYWHAAYTSNPESNVPGFARAKLTAVQYTDGKSGNRPRSAAGIGACDMNYIK